MFLAEVEFVSV